MINFCKIRLLLEVFFLEKALYFKIPFYIRSLLELLLEARDNSNMLSGTSPGQAVSHPCALHLRCRSRAPPLDTVGTSGIDARAHKAQPQRQARTHTHAEHGRARVRGQGHRAGAARGPTRARTPASGALPYVNVARGAWTGQWRRAPARARARPRPARGDGRARDDGRAEWGFRAPCWCSRSSPRPGARGAVRRRARLCDSFGRAWRGRY